MDEPHTWGISRRAFLSRALASAGGLAVVQEANASSVAPAERKPFVYQFRIGEIDAWSISDGYLTFRNPLGLMWPQETREEMRRWLELHREPLDALFMDINVLLIRVGSEVVLFDAGFGPRSSAETGWVVKEGLRQIGIAPEQVTAGFLSHAHADHLGGFVRDARPAFPNAAFHALPEEYAFWHQRDPDFSRSKRDKAPLPGMIRQVRSEFDALRSVYEPIRDGTSLYGGAVTVEAAPGHTAGHAIFRIRSGGESLLHLMDLAHHRGLMFHDPGWTIAFDHDPEQAVRTRRAVFARTAAERTRCYGFHLPWPGLGHILPNGGGYQWHPESWRWRD
jgi:glyoxylase-like metal-dependent hydrolase (beta-lactamase superfamily II)